MLVCLRSGQIMIGNGTEKRGLLRAVWNSTTIQNALKVVDSHWLWDGNRIAWYVNSSAHASSILLILFRCTAKAPRDELRVVVDMDRERGRAPRVDKETGQVIENKVRVVIKVIKPIRMAVVKAYLDKVTGFDTTVLEAISKYCFYASTSSN